MSWGGWGVPFAYQPRWCKLTTDNVKPQDATIGDVRVGLYVRVSSEVQTVKNQELELRRYAKLRKYAVVAVYSDNVTDHRSGETERPGFGKLMHDARVRKFDRVLVWSLDRISRRGIGPVFTVLGQLRACGVGWESLQEPWATDAGPAGEVLLAVLAWASAQERKRISERTRAAMARRKALGLPMGRPKGSRDRRPRRRRYAKRPAVGAKP